MTFDLQVLALVVLAVALYLLVRVVIDGVDRLPAHWKRIRHG